MQGTINVTCAGRGPVRERKHTGDFVHKQHAHENGRALGQGLPFVPLGLGLCLGFGTKEVVIFLGAKLLEEELHIFVEVNGGDLREEKLRCEGWEGVSVRSSK